MRNMRRLEAGRPAVLGTLFCAMVLSLLAVSGCGEQLARMEENQVKLEAMVAANARQLATLSSQIQSTDSKLDAGIRDLDADAEQIATKVSAIQSGQLQLREAVATGNQRTDKGITQLENNQRLLRDGVAQLSETSGHAAEDLKALAAEHAALHETVRANQQELTASIGAVASNQQRIETGIVQLQQTGRTLADGHERLSEDILNIHTVIEAVSADLTAFGNEQTLSHAAQQDGTRALADKVAIVESTQRNILATVDETAGVVRKTAADVTPLAEGQAAIREAIRISRDVLTGQMAAGLQDQQALQTSVQGLHGRMDAMDAGIGQVVAGQASLREALGTNHNSIITAMAGLSDEQQGVSDQLDILTATAGQTALDVLAMDAGQISLRQALQTGLGALAEQQTAIRQSVREGNETLAARMGNLEKDGDAMTTALDRIGGATQQSAAGIAAMAAAQDAVRQALETHGKETGNRISSLLDGQERLHNQLDIVTATAGQTAIDVIDIAGRQEALRAATQGHGESINTHAAKLAETQAQIHDRLDILTATAGQTALDVIGLSDGQAGLERAVQANGRELADRLTAIAQGQQDWLKGLDAAQAKVQTMVEGMAALEEQIATLRGSLQTAMQNVATRVDADSRQRQELNAKISQDMQAMIEAVSQLRQMQTTLQEQMTQVQKSTQSQAETIKAAIQRMKQPPDEVKVSEVAAKAAVPVAPTGE